MMGIRLRHLVGIGPRPGRVLDPNSEVCFVPMEALADGLGGIDASLTRPAGAVSSGSYNYFEPGDVLLAKVTPCFENGKKALVPSIPGGIGFATSEVHVVRPRPDKIDPRFLLYLLSSEPFRAEGMASMTGAGGLKRVSEAAILNHRPLVNDLVSQKRIAAFLDAETTRIDALIEKKRRLVDALIQKSRDYADLLVTGHDAPGREMTVNDAPWLTSIPATWQQKRAKFLFQEMSRPVKDDDGVITAFRDGQVCLRSRRRSEGYTFAELEVGYQHIRRGDLVIHSMDAFAGAIGVSEDDGKATGEYAVCAPRSDDVNCEYYAHVLRCMARREYIFVLCPSVRERAPRFRYVRFAPVLLPVPPREEQDQIVARISSATKGSLSVREKTATSIDRLREYRSSLITEAVSGQLDIDTWRKRGAGDAQLDRIATEMGE